MTTMYEINRHYKGAVFSHCTVTPITILRRGVSPGCIAESIDAKSADGRTFRGIPGDFFDTEEAAWNEVRRAGLYQSGRLERRVMHLETRMSDYKRVPTSADVWAVIRARHPELRVFGSYSAPNGDEFGDPNKGRMFTSYGFEHGDYPVIEAQTTWDIDPETPHKRNNQQHEYWLCLPKREDA